VDADLSLACRRMFAGLSGGSIVESHERSPAGKCNSPLLAVLQRTSAGSGRHKRERPCRNAAVSLTREAVTGVLSHKGVKASRMRSQCDRLDRHGAEHGACVIPQGVCPLLPVPGVAPGRLMGGDVELCTVIEGRRNSTCPGFCRSRSSIGSIPPRTGRRPRRRASARLTRDSSRAPWPALSSSRDR